jgi:hypothetical protein
MIVRRRDLNAKAEKSSNHGFDLAVSAEREAGYERIPETGMISLVAPAHWMQRNHLIIRGKRKPVHQPDAVSGWICFFEMVEAAPTYRKPVSDPAFLVTYRY